MNTPVEYSWTFRKHLTLFIITYCSKKLYHYRIRGITNDWFRSYLTNRTHQIKVNGTISKKTEITYGVPQGSILGSLLFLVYIIVNDLHEAVTHSLIHHFADDTNILYSKSFSKKLINTLPMTFLNCSMAKSKQNFLQYK